MPGSPEERLRGRIEASGPIPFADFMETALYGEGGYYVGAAAPLGRQGDFITGSSFSPLFARCTATLLSRLDAVSGVSSDYVEVGYGSGAHLEAVARLAGSRRRVAGWDRSHRPVEASVERLAGLDDLGPRSVDGIVLSYELFDSLPVHRIVRRADGSLGELLVGLDADRRFAWRESELSDPGLSSLVAANELEVGQVADLAPGWGPLYARLASRLGVGLLVSFDYGFDRRRLLDARIRRHGTLACYSRQQVHRDPFRAVGRQDLTAHVDFTLLRQTGEAAGLETYCLTRQASWLLATGIFEHLSRVGEEERRDAQRLLDGAGMGEEIRVLVQSRGLDAARVLPAEMVGRASADISP